MSARRRTVGDELVEAVEAADLDQALPAELGVVGDDQRARAARQHHARELRLFEIVVHDAALGVDRAGRDDRMGDAEAADELDRRDAEGGAAVAAQLAARHVDLVAVDGGQRAGDVGRVGDDGQPAVAEQFARQEAGRRAGIEHDRFAVADGRGDGLRDGALGLGVLAHAPLERRLAGKGRQPDRAMHLQHRAVAGQRLHVAAHRLQRNVELVGKVGDGDRALLAEQAQDFGVALGMSCAPSDSLSACL